MKKEKPFYRGKEFDSKDELYFFCWCEELERFNLLQSFEYHPAPFVLSGQVKVTKYTETYKTKKKGDLKQREIDFELLKPHHYTCDFVLSFTPEQFGKMKFFFDLGKIKIYPVFGSSEVTVYIDCKPKGYGMKNMNAIFSINRKWVWQEYSIFVHKVSVFDWFKSTFAPINFHLTNKRKSIQYQVVGKFIESTS